MTGDLRLTTILAERFTRESRSGAFAPGARRRPRAPSAAASALRSDPTLANGAAAVERDDRGDELDHIVVDRAWRARQPASGSRRRAFRPPHAPRPARAPAARSSRRDTEFLRARIAGADLDRDDAPARRRARRPRPAARTRSGAAKPRRCSPAAASTSASCAPSSSFRSRVSRLPRIAVELRAWEQPCQLSDAPNAPRADRRRLPERGRRSSSTVGHG